jgi:hypothetical protein
LAGARDGRDGTGWQGEDEPGSECLGGIGIAQGGLGEAIPFSDGGECLAGFNEVRFRCHRHRGWLRSRGGFFFVRAFAAHTVHETIHAFDGVADESGNALHQFPAFVLLHVFAGAADGGESDGEKKEEENAVEAHPHPHHGPEARGAAVGELLDDGLQQVSEDAGEGDGDEHRLEELQHVGEDADGINDRRRDGEHGDRGHRHP